MSTVSPDAGSGRTGGTATQTANTPALAADTFAVARSLVARGWSVFPLKPREKTPAIRSWKDLQDRLPTEQEMDAWWADGSGRGIALVTGARSVVVLDLDGKDAVLKVKERGLPLPETVAQHTGGGGYQIFYAHPHPETPIPNRTDLLGTKEEGWAIDVRGDGGYVCIPPSRHPSGRRYEWVPGHSPDEIALAPLPEEWRALLDAPPHEPQAPAPQKPEAKARGAALRPAQDDLRDRLRGIILRDLARFLGSLGVQITKQAARRGGEIEACCPLPGHADKTPSWRMNVGTGLWKCFGCGKEGDPFTLYCEVRRVDFATALAEITEQYAACLLSPARASTAGSNLLAAAIRSIRTADNLPAPVKQSKVRDLVLKVYSQRGKFLHTPQGEAFFFERADHRLLALEDAAFRARFTLDTGLPLAEAFGKQTFEYLAAHALVKGEIAEPHRLAWWDRDKRVLHLDCFDGTTLALDGETIRSGCNGDGCLFLSRPEWVPWRLVDTNSDDRDDFFRLMLQANFDPESDLTAEESAAAFYAWLAGPFFGSLLPTRPPALFLGEAGSGKSCQGRLILRWTYGGHADVTPINRDREDAFDAVVTGEPLCVFDNVDTAIPWLNDKLAVLATGGDISRRQLYTTNALVKYRADCFALLTARTPRFRREDVAERLLILKLAPLPTKLPEDLLLSEVEQKRDRLWSVWARELNALVKLVREGLPTESLSFRLADWGRLFLVVLRHLHPDWSDTRGKQVLAKLTGLQQSFMIEDDPVLGMLLDWLKEPGSNRWDRAIAPAALFAELSRFAEDRRERFQAANSSWLSRHIQKHQEALASQEGVEVRASRSSERRWLAFHWRQP